MTRRRGIPASRVVRRSMGPGDPDIGMIRERRSTEQPEDVASVLMRSVRVALEIGPRVVGL